MNLNPTFKIHTWIILLMTWMMMKHVSLEPIRHIYLLLGSNFYYLVYNIHQNYHFSYVIRLNYLFYPKFETNQLLLVRKIDNFDIINHHLMCKLGHISNLFLLKDFQNS